MNNRIIPVILMLAVIASSSAAFGEEQRKFKWKSGSNEIMATQNTGIEKFYSEVEILMNKNEDECMNELPSVSERYKCKNKILESWDKLMNDYYNEGYSELRVVTELFNDVSLGPKIGLSCCFDQKMTGGNSMCSSEDRVVSS
jgi:hypothetical protein